MVASSAAIVATIGDGKLRDLYRYWISVAPPDMLPGRQHIEPGDIVALLPWITLIDLSWETERPRLRSRLVGTGVAEYFRRDITDLYAEDAYESPYLEQVQETYGRIARTKEPEVSHHEIPIPDLDHIGYRRLALPLARDGKTVDMFLGCFEFNDKFTNWIRATEYSHVGKLPD